MAHEDGSPEELLAALAGVPTADNNNIPLQCAVQFLNGSIDYLKAHAAREASLTTTPHHEAPCPDQTPQVVQSASKASVQQR